MEPAGGPGEQSVGGGGGAGGVCGNPPHPERGCAGLGAVRSRGVGSIPHPASRVGISRALRPQLGAAGAVGARCRPPKGAGTIFRVTDQNWSLAGSAAPLPVPRSGVRGGARGCAGLGPAAGLTFSTFPLAKPGEKIKG